MALFRALFLNLFIIGGMTVRVENDLTDELAVDGAIDLAAHLEDFSSLRSNKTDGQDCDTPAIRTAAAKYEQALITSKSPQRHPSAVLMVGGPGSGKSTARRLVAPDAQYAIMDVDDILKEVYTPEADSYYDCYEPAMVLYKKWLATLIESKINLVIDGTGRKFDEYVSFATELKKQSYGTALVSVVLPFEVAKERMEKRAKIENRVVDTKYAESVYNKIEEILPRYLQQDVFDSVFVYSNNVEEHHSPDRLLLKKKNKIMCSFGRHVHDSPVTEALQQFCG